ncbi:MAG: (d)CMP kinase [Candidatus Cloacimonetes bacterium]|nr:(d)CMP kinase [Candidatus Cloacimonadota bacterium]
MERKLIIAIDGPASSGKSSSAKILASRLHYVYIDTGAMYRACALCSLKRNIDLNDLSALTFMLADIRIDIRYAPDGNRLILNGEDVSERIREEDISRLSSQIATIGVVREKMVDLQRKLGEQGGVIMDGRDIGTVVFPHADIKFFLVADMKTRAKRRWIELEAKGLDPDLAEVEQEMIWRDKNDSNRAIAPLRRAHDAIEIDTGDLSLDDQVELLHEHIRSLQQ